MTFHEALAELRRAIYVYQMNLHKLNVSPEAKERMRLRLVEAAHGLGRWVDPHYKGEHND